jgi:peptidoglycan/LPS O-acetylase OafA/YrhL
MRKPTESALEYRPQLDGLRAIAVTMVLLHHFDIGQGMGLEGVMLFFVLSGFLITSILLRMREQINATNVGIGWGLRQFYARRFLRIFPLYYLVIFVALAFNVTFARDYAGWLLTYTINLKMASQGWYIANFAHFWSLAVEEQYYIFWPWLVLILPTRFLLPVTLLMIAIGPLYRFINVLAWTYWESDRDGLVLYISTLTSLDSLGMGSLLAVASAKKSTKPQMLEYIRMFALPVGLAILVSLKYASSTALGNKLEMVLYNTVIATIFTWAVLAASSGFKGVPRRILEFPPLVYIGKISYGVYVYHLLVPGLLASILGLAGFSLPSGVWAQFVIYTIATLMLATVSWFTFELPINRIKRKFPYTVRPVQNVDARRN